MTGGPGFPAPGVPPATALRVSDAEREQAVELLQNAFAEGRIDHTELDRRIEGALAARDRADLSHALRGLPLSTGMPHNATSAVQTPGAGGPTPSADERTWALIAHWSGLFTLFVVPALIAVTKGKESAFVREQAWEAANFNLAFVGANIAVGVGTAITFGIAGLLFVPLLFVWLVLMGVGGLSAAAGNRWRYPWNVRLLG
ncbi:DUF1707 and DUF4870 domain-containing protein [Actinopolymorpha alba]|uniref:DUF1707 and DUF4870 domain-containing protein n=1 Tax=Actinopolymorpha alba TaxID=533267 RepID=UPI00037DFA8B|nr:DUF1707 and DUF4870 domain-containing protein [Actinopolymorpha alba]